MERSMAHSLPIRCHATEAWLMCSDDSGLWSRRHSFPLRQLS